VKILIFKIKRIVTIELAKTHALWKCKISINIFKKTDLIQHWKIQSRIICSFGEKRILQFRWNIKSMSF